MSNRTGGGERGDSYSIITKTRVTTEHHIISRVTKERINLGEIEGVEIEGDIRARKLKLSHVDHAFVHYATWVRTKDPREFEAYRGQEGYIKTKREKKLLRELTEDEELIKAWGDPIEVERRTRNTHFL